MGLTIYRVDLETQKKTKVAGYDRINLSTGNDFINTHAAAEANVRKGSVSYSKENIPKKDGKVVVRHNATVYSDTNVPVARFYGVWK